MVSDTKYFWLYIQQQDIRHDISEMEDCILTAAIECYAKNSNGKKLAIFYYTKEKERYIVTLEKLFGLIFKFEN